LTDALTRPAPCFATLGIKAGVFGWAPPGCSTERAQRKEFIGLVKLATSRAKRITNLLAFKDCLTVNTV
jgi:hypothetical protein